MRLKALLLAGAMALGGSTAAQAQTNITPDVGARGLGTTVTQSGASYAIDGGTRAGANLFHSFNRFDVGGGDTARWTRAGGDAAQIANVISRVTGGQASTIAGTLDSTALPNASFFFINPAGVVFTEGSRVNVPGAAHFSTAGSLRFADGLSFAAAAPDGSTLSMAAPESFGFVGGQGAITVATGIEGGFANPEASISLSGSNVTLRTVSMLVRGLDLVAVGSGPGRLTLSDPLAAGRGTVTIDDAIITAAPAGGRGASFRIGGGRIVLADAFLALQSGDAASGPFALRAPSITARDSFINTLAMGAARGGDLSFTAGAIDLENTFIGSDARGTGRGGDILIDTGSLSLRLFSNVSASTTNVARGGDIVVGADTLSMEGGSLLTLTSGAGAGGHVRVSAGDVTLDGAFLSSSALAAGAGGDVTVDAVTLTATDSLFTSSASGGGAGGEVTLSAGVLDLIESFGTTSATGSTPGDVVLLGDLVFLSGGFYGSIPGEQSDSGDIFVLADTRVELVGTLISTSSFSSGAAGSIVVDAPEVLVLDSTIDSNAYDVGDGGAVIFRADNLVFDESSVEAETLGGGRNAGIVRLESTGDLLLFNTQVASNASSTAPGGVVSIEGRDVGIFESTIAADTFAEGDAGLVSITADTLLVENSLISSDTTDIGRAGGVLLDARSITLDVSTGVSSTTFGEGAAGDVTVDAVELTLLDGSTITSKAEASTGDAGTVSIDADRIRVVGGSFISSDTETSGDAGQVFIRTGDLTVDGQGATFTYITSDSLGRGDAGGVTINATRSITLIDGGFVSSNSFNDGSAGSVDIRAPNILVENGSFIASDTRGPGDAGDVTIATTTLRVRGGESGEITYVSSDSVFGEGAAGTVTIDARTVEVTDSAFISSDAYDIGDAGDVIIRTDTLLVDTDGSVRSGTFGLGDAGDVTIVARSIRVGTSAAISSEAFAGSDGFAGFVDITADELIVRDEGRVSTSTGGFGDAGAVFVDAGRVVLDGGVISSAAEARAFGASGDLFIEADTLTVTGGGSITTASINPNPAGTIFIEAGTLDVFGAGSAIASENQAGNRDAGASAGGSGDAGAVLIEAGRLRIAEGGRITTNSFSGAAGAIDIEMPQTSILRLEGVRLPGSIETSSGAGTGGMITISSPLAIINNGGSILALGEAQGANVVIESLYFVNSSDRENIVAVDGEFRLAAGLYDVSSGTVTRNLSVVDASKVLQGQCPVARATGQVSQLVTRPVGPYVRDPVFDLFRRPERPAPQSGGCP